jgi:hypothetical protein
MSLVDRLLPFVPEAKRNSAAAMGGMALLLGGQKIAGLTLFGSGIAGLERTWRARNPEFQGGFRERWQRAAAFYEQTHRDPTNRVLHMVGIPLIVGGALGLLASRPPRPLWALSAAAFTGGWALNFVGHFRYEKNRPAFEDDPLSFVAGPVWDLGQVRKLVVRRVLKAGPETA